MYVTDVVRNSIKNHIIIIILTGNINVNQKL